jgi:hypothetical protein
MYIGYEIRLQGGHHLSASDIGIILLRGMTHNRVDVVFGHLPPLFLPLTFRLSPIAYRVRTAHLQFIGNDIMS